MKTKSFYYPNINNFSVPIMPIFLPFWGCKDRCVYCNQYAQTGAKILSVDDILVAVQVHLQEQKKNNKNIGIGLYGGSFTALPRKDIIKILSVLLEYKKQGIIVHIRCSTRPDYIDTEIVELLKFYGVDLIELGCQSFATSVLLKSKRSYTAQTIKDACDIIKTANLELGVQLLPGLPEFNLDIWVKDIEQTINLKPTCVRIYPCLVFEKTVLEKWWKDGDYQPWDLQTAVEQVGLSVFLLHEAHIQTIRLGVMLEAENRKSCIAGPYHAEFGNMAKSYALYLFLRKNVINTVLEKIIIPRKFQGDLWGFKGQMRNELAKINISKENTIFKKQENFEILMK